MSAWRSTPETVALTPRRSLLSSLGPSPSTPAARARPRGGFTSWSVFGPGLSALAGSHRVQRVPTTEKRGRRHSSVVIVVVLDEHTRGREPVLRDRDGRVEFYRDSGPGGQHRNKVATATRMTHVPTRVVVTATEERSQHQNRQVARARLEAELVSRARAAVHTKVNSERRAAHADHRSFTWTGWRDEVRGGSKASMRRVLAGRLEPLVR